MPLIITRNDITKMAVDSIVNGADPSLLGGGGADGAIHRAAGPELLAECKALGGCAPGQAKVTRGYALPCKYVIHTVSPLWQGGGQGERELLASCYRSCLEQAAALGCESIAFPLLAAGSLGYPREEALRVAVDSISGFLFSHDISVHLVVFDRDSFRISEKLFSQVAAYVDDNYVDQRLISESRRMPREDGENILRSIRPGAAYRGPAPADAAPMSRPLASQSLGDLNDAVSRLDESFSQALLRLIDQRGMTDAECYKKANIDRKLFSKIRGNIHYRPSKPTAVAFAVALELSLDETRDLLQKAGFALSPSQKFDLIVEYFIKSGNYDIFQINEALFAFDQSLLGA